MSTATRSPTSTRTPYAGLAGRIVVATLAALLLGGLTSYAQGMLPDALRSLANSASGWTVLTVLVVAALRPGLRLGAVLGVVSFVALVMGYTVTAELRGSTYDPVLWSLVGVLAGPFVGAAAAALRGTDRVPAALGSALVAAILLSEGGYGLTVVAGSTSPAYWTLAITGGVALLVVVAARRLRSTRLVLLQVATTVALCTLASLGFAALNGL